MKALARHILLAALLLRALVPLGWMPGQASLGQATWTICTADGSVQHGVPGKDDGHQQPCAFAAVHFTAPQLHAFAAPLLRAAAVESVAVSATLRFAAGYAPQSPRAPPVSA